LLHFYTKCTIKLKLHRNVSRLNERYNDNIKKISKKINKKENDNKKIVFYYLWKYINTRRYNIIILNILIKKYI